MRATVCAFIGLVLSTGAAAAVENDNSDTCKVADNLVHADFSLPEVAAAIHAQHLSIVVVGSGSSTLGGSAGPTKAYPARLEAVLRQRLPDTMISVTPFVMPRQTAAEMLKEFAHILAEAKPALVVWQTGTTDAMRGVDPDEFRSALDEGVETLRAKKTDILFMNMQYSPRTESVISTDTYAEAMRFVALQYEVSLFDRLAIMRHWSETGTFDLFATTKNPDMAEQVHDCLGRLLADEILEAAKMSDTVGSQSTGKAP